MSQLIYSVRDPAALGFEEDETYTKLSPACDLWTTGGASPVSVWLEMAKVSTFHGITTIPRHHLERLLHESEG